MKHKIKKYFKIWLTMTLKTFKADISNRFAAIVLLLGKILRFVFQLGFLYILLSQSKDLAGYNFYQVAFFFLTFNLIDIIAQLFYRGVYMFRPLIVSGDFDLILVKPVNPLFRSLTSNADVLDFITLFPLIAFIIYFLASGYLSFSLNNLLLYLFFIIISFIIATSFNILILAIGVMTTEVDHLIWIYRDLSSMGRIPIDIYQQGIRFILTFILPVGVLMSFPAKALMGLLPLPLIIYSILLAIVLLFSSYQLWLFSLRKYSSASS